LLLEKIKSKGVEMKTYKIAVLAGDGTGPEVIAEGRKVLAAASSKFGFKLDYTEYDLGGRLFLRTGETLPDSVLAELRKVDSIYLGAIGTPDVKPGILEQGVLLKLRRELDQYINLRPVKLYDGVECPIKGKGPADIDFVVVRENTEGLYTSSGGFLKKGTPDEVAIQTSINTRKGAERCIRFAFELCRSRGGKKLVTLCGKTNVLTFAWDLWERTFNEVAKEYPDIKTNYHHVDATVMYMVRNPEWYDVIVTDNIFGDIITDLAAILQGGLGVAPGGNINPEGVSMFEPIGGSAPQFTGLGVINPVAAILAGAMMIESLGEKAAAKAVEQAVMQTIKNDMKGMDVNKMGISTSQVGDKVVSYLTK
jgi:3-isopropylmalate dehydrogenase